jgi:transaldolase/glucose-6-phosphate isomerase
MDAFRQAGTVSASLTQDIDGARKVLADAQRFGLDLDGVTTALVPDGTQQFRDAADGLYGAVGAKRIDFLGKKLNAATFELPKPLADAVDKTLDVARSQGWSRRVWSDDASLWTGKDESQWLGWLAAGQGRQVDTDAVAALARGLKAEGFTDAVLLGMGGSSLGPEVLSETLGSTGGAPVLHVLDTTNPAQIKVVEDRIDIAHTLFIVSSKSGSTLEPEILNAYFHAAASDVVGKDKAGKQFIAITDPGSKLDAAAKAGGYRAIFHGDPAIGGRYSVLSVFGMVPLGVIGHDVRKFFDTTQTMVHACGPSAPPQVNPGVHLGVILGEAAVAGRDKLTVFASQSVSTVGSWLEQLLAESTGKQGKGIVPVDQEPIGGPESYGQDRVFAYLKVSGDKDDGVDARLKALAAAGHPVVRITLDRADAIGQEFFRWEMATAIAGAVIGIDPFDQPDVEASKLKTRALTDAFEKSGKFDAETAFAKEAGLNFFGDASLKGDGSADAVIKNHLARLKAGDYAAVLAYIERDPANETWIELLRVAIRDAWKVATVGGFGPRFLHSTGQAYKGGPNSGVFLQITADPASDLAIPGRKISFGKVQFAQARGDLEVLAERGRRYLRVHIEGDIQTGLKRIAQAVIKATA